MKFHKYKYMKFKFLFISMIVTQHALITAYMSLINLVQETSTNKSQTKRCTPLKNNNKN